MLLKSTMACVADRVRPFLAVLWILGALQAFGGSEVPADVALRAALIYRFTTLTEFPTASFTNEDSAVRIVVFGQDTVAGPLEKASEGKKVWGRPIVVTRTTSIDETTNAHVLVIGASQAATVEALLKSLREKPVLTIGGSDSFCAQGGMLNISRREQRLVFDVNADAVKRAGQKGLYLNPIVYKLGKTVRE